MASFPHDLSSLPCKPPLPCHDAPLPSFPCAAHLSAGFLRFFPAWPMGERASFRGLRASGAFVVSAAIDEAGSVSGVRLTAEAGGECTILDPWRGTHTNNKDYRLNG